MVNIIKWFFSHKGKVEYPTKNSALKSLINHPKKTRVGLEVYKCKYCYGWHIGHKKEFKRKFSFKIGVGDG